MKDVCCVCEEREGRWWFVGLIPLCARCWAWLDLDAWIAKHRS